MPKISIKLSEESVKKLDSLVAEHQVFIDLLCTTDDKPVTRDEEIGILVENEFIQIFYGPRPPLAISDDDLPI